MVQLKGQLSYELWRLVRSCQQLKYSAQSQLSGKSIVDTEIRNGSRDKDPKPKFSKVSTGPEKPVPVFFRTVDDIYIYRLPSTVRQKKVPVLTSKKYRYWPTFFRLVLFVTWNLNEKRVLVYKLINNIMSYNSLYLSYSADSDKYDL